MLRCNRSITHSRPRHKNKAKKESPILKYRPTQRGPTSTTTDLSDCVVTQKKRKKETKKEEEEDWTGGGKKIEKEKTFSIIRVKTSLFTTRFVNTERRPKSSSSSIIMADAKPPSSSSMVEFTKVRRDDDVLFFAIFDFFCRRRLRFRGQRDDVNDVILFCFGKKRRRSSNVVLISS